ncbi:Protein IVY1 [Escovopsis weberi]|uniref:Protein IVY1 n=1 Tax=Escovopsis weberi TaxID=150374 RepID=A0A0M8N0S2_ESCWE|nr:Protein IVY1 [Escovopsis weberi]
MAMTSSAASRPASPAPSQPPRAPASPSVFSLASTANPLSQYALPLPPPRPAHIVITKADLERSHEAYADLLASAKAYRLALAALSTAASTFGSALEACARLKEARAEPIGPAGAAPASTMSASFTAPRGACTADMLLAASGVHHLIANHKQILSETVYRSFEVPLLHDLDKWRGVIDDEEQTYQHNIRAQSREVKRLEKDGLKLHRQRRRDVARFRAHLVELTGQLDGLTALHADHARTLLRESQETSGRIVDAGCSLVRAEVDIFESLARKGWSGGGLDDLLEKGQDLFAADDGGGGPGGPGGHHGAAAVGSDGAKLFSILPPKSILADSASAPGPESSLLIEPTDRYQSLAGAAAGVAERKQSSGEDADSVFSAEFNRPRGARPFSPQPIRRPPTDVTYDTLSAGGIGGGAPALPNVDDDLPGMTSLQEEGEDDDDDEEEDDTDDVEQEGHEEEEEEEEEIGPHGRLAEVDERESVLTNEDSAHWEPHDEGEEVYHLRRRRTTQDSNGSDLLMGGRGKMMRGDGDGKEPEPRVLGIEPSPESAWGSPGKEDYAD